MPAACRVLFLAVRTASHSGEVAAEDRREVTTLRAGRVRAAMLWSHKGERAERTDGQRAGPAVGNVAELTALHILESLQEENSFSTLRFREKRFNEGMRARTSGWATETTIKVAVL